MKLYASEFRRYAKECRQLARTTRTAEGKHYWTKLAERWERCAENAELVPAPTRKRRTNRRPDPINENVA
jgi:hypothetical protein